MTRRIFISYRRGTSAAAAGRLYDHLLQHFDGQDLFMDVDAIEPGVDFVRTLDEQVSQCSAFVAVIGQGWADVKDASGRRRLEDPHDYVRVEIEAALGRDIRVIPVLVDEARMPAASELPDTLAPLVRRQGFEVAHQRFASDVDRLAAVLQKALGVPSLPAKATAEEPARAPVAAPAAMAPAATPGLGVGSWIELLFSFKGRVSRRGYWIGGAAVALVALLAQSLLLATLVTGPAADAPDPSSTRLVTLIAAWPFYWPALALFMKRLHDIGQGWGLFLPIVWLLPIQVGLSLAGFPLGSMIPLGVGLSACLIVGFVPGTPGSNEYGADPHGRAAMSSPAPAPSKA